MAQKKIPFFIVIFPAAQAASGAAYYSGCYE